VSSAFIHGTLSHGNSFLPAGSRPLRIFASRTAVKASKAGDYRAAGGRFADLVRFHFSLLPRQTSSLSPTGRRELQQRILGMPRVQSPLSLSPGGAAVKIIRLSGVSHMNHFPCPYFPNLRSERKLIWWREPPSSARSAPISPTTGANLKP